jgi:DNA-binding HxlR family transcriptional regulator
VDGAGHRRAPGRSAALQRPPRVDYELTDLGASLTGPIQTLTDWAETHLAQILGARETYDVAADTR